MSAHLQIEALTGGYHDTNVLFDVSARVDRGEVLGIFGRNGVGKTTLVRLVQGGLRLAGGAVRLKGREVSRLAPWDRRALGLGYMPQTDMVFDDLTVRENLMLGENARAPEEYFDLFPRLAERQGQLAGSMSGGERKILAFVRTMIEDSDVLILDEPSEGVQPENIERMAQCLRARAEAGAAVVLIEQNIGFLTSIADHLLGLDAGRVVLQETAGRVSAEEVRALLTV